MFGRLGGGFWRRLLQAPIVLLVLVTISFFMMRLAPGGPFDTEKVIDPTVLEERNRQYGLDKSLPGQYVHFLGRLVQGDLGMSFTRREQSVNSIIATFMPTSILLGAMALILALVVGVLSGTVAALRRNSLLDHSTMTLVMLGVSIPTFVIAPLLQIVFGIWLSWLPIAGYQGWQAPLFLVLPAVTLAAPFAARIAGLTRAGMLEVLQQDFIRTARAKGLGTRVVLARHALRGGILPVVAFLGPAIASVLTGSLVVEQIFGIPGLGKEFVQSALSRDYTVVMGTVIVYGVLIIACNMLADIMQALLDPRVQHD